MIFLFLLGVTFDAAHCKRKCESLFGDSPSKKSLCLGTCSNGFVTREKIQYGDRQMKKEVITCLARCSQNVNSSTNFKDWAKCRRTCVVNSQTERREFFAADSCYSECDRYWKGTVHWKPCQDQCRLYAAKARPDPTPAPEMPNIFHVW